MRVTKSLHANDLVELTRSEMHRLMQEDCSFVSCGIEVKMIRRPDRVYEVRTYEHSESKESNQILPHFCWPSDVSPAQLRLTFDGETGKLKKAEIL
jgi:hypothetical protein